MQRSPKSRAVAARALRREGLTLEAIADTVGLSRSTVHRMVDGIPSRAQAESRRRRAAIPPPWIDDASRLLAEGKSRLEIAGIIGVSKSVLYRAVDKFIGRPGT